MDFNVRNIFNYCNYRRVASIAVIGTCVFSYFIQNAHCSANEDIAKEVLETHDTDLLKGRFDELENLIGKSDNFIRESRKFIEEFLAQVHTQYGISLSIIEACQLIIENLSSLGLPPETQESLLMAIDILLPEKPIEMNLAAESNGLGKWFQNGWDYLRGKKPIHKGTYKIKIIPSQISGPKPSQPDVELPGNIYAGAMEIFAGALLCIIPHPYTWAIGGFMIGDGTRRIADGYIQASDEKRLHMDYNF